MYEAAHSEGDRRQDLTGAHTAAESARARTAAVPWRTEVRRKLDDLLVRMAQGRSLPDSRS
jgi:hypothetical protein